ncbi:MAG: hypothetical protein H6Q23_2327 [Bacteroidetes bacterium]|jgi:hypothetical protein|nr:hypothetical protein [Bacteroidota bacterium]
MVLNISNLCEKIFSYILICRYSASYMNGYRFVSVRQFIINLSQNYTNDNKNEDYFAII